MSVTPAHNIVSAAAEPYYNSSKPPQHHPHQQHFSRPPSPTGSQQHLLPIKQEPSISDRPLPHPAQAHFHSSSYATFTQHLNGPAAHQHRSQTSTMFDDDDDEDDIDHDDEVAQSAYATAYNSAYNSEDDGADDVSMDGVVLRDRDEDDHEMADASSTPARANITRFHASVPSSTPASTPPISSASTVPLTGSTSVAPSLSSAPVNIRPKPTLRPLLPSRPTSPQPTTSIFRPLTPGRALKAEGTDASSSATTTLASSIGGSANTSKSNVTLGTKTRSSAYKINGLNILNRNSLDSKTALEMLRRRRENHNHVERRRRDTLNSTILQMAEILPHCSSTAKLNKGTILRLALEHMKTLQAENHQLRSENAALRFFYHGAQPRRSGPVGTAVGPVGPPAPGPPGTHGIRPYPPAPENMGAVPPVAPHPGAATTPGTANGSPTSAHPPKRHILPQTAAAIAPAPLPAPAPASAAAHTSASMPVPAVGHGAQHAPVTSGHLQPILPRQTGPSPASSPRARLMPQPSPNGLRPFSDAIRLGPSPLASPCPSPPLGPQGTHSVAHGAHHHYSQQQQQHPQLSALPALPPAGHQQSAAAAAAAVAAAAAAAAKGSSARHHKTGSQCSSSSSSTAGGVLAPPSRKSSVISRASSPTSSSPSSSNPSSTTPSAATSPYVAPYPPHAQSH
ncbi:Sterol regulatory element-binding protein 1, partial [Actinomortierella ambigua]